MYTPKQITDLKSDPAILQVVQARVPSLEQIGAEWKGNCPFHDENTPSFTVRQDDGIYLFKCFGCGKNGNLLQFVQFVDNISFNQAVEKVADLIGWKKGKESVEQTFKALKEEKEVITFPLAKIAEAELALRNSKAGLDWLASRGLSLETAAKFHLGYVQSARAVNPHHEKVNDGWIIFPTHDGTTITALKYRSVVGKDFLYKTGMKVSLFNLADVDVFEDVFVVEGECLSGDTEVLTPRGWVRLDQYTGQDVVQWTESRAAQYVKPIAYIKKPFIGEMIHFCSKTKVVDLLVTPNHRVIYKNPRGALEVREAKNVPNAVGFYRTAVLETDGIRLFDDEIRLQVAIQADGSQIGFAHSPGQTDGWVFGFSKVRKIQRLEALLKKLCIEFKKAEYAKQTTFRFRTPPGKFTKVFSDPLFQMNLSQRMVFLEEIPFWDGNDSDKAVMYRTIVEKNADIVQWAYVMSGLSAKKGQHDRPNKHPIYWISHNHRKKRGNQSATSRNAGIKNMVSYSGDVYCLQVPSSFLMVRRNGSVVVTGNCDAMAMKQAGFPCVAYPSAGYTPTPDERDALTKANRIFLAGDMDNPGQQAMTKLWTELRERTFKIEWPAGMKDANQTFLENCGGNLGEFKARIEQLKKKALEQPIPFIYDLRQTLRTASYTKPMDNPSRLFFPWPSIDSWGAVLPGDVMFVMATETGVGKSSWAMNILLENAVKHGKVVVNYSAEISPQNYAIRAAAYLLQKKKDDITEEDLQTAADLMGEAQFYNGYKPGANWKDVIELLSWAKRRLGADILVLDHLHFLTRSERDEIKAQAEAMRMLKDLAVQYNIIMIVVGQPRKPLSTHRGREAVTQDAKGSEAVGSDSSQVFILHRDRKSNGDDSNLPIFDPVCKVKLDKSRESEPRATKLFFDGARCTFGLLERNYDEYAE